ncbi:MAG: FAD-binding oxidoreductase, partial [Pseudomonadota bacterium]
MKRSVDIAIIGQGLAGTTLAWTLLDQGARIAVIDQRLIGAASTVAGGLITPLTGKKIKPEPYFDELWEAAQAHYQRVSHWLDTDVLNTRAALRRLDTTQLKEAWNTADETQKRYAELASAPPEAVSGESSFIAMPTAARLDIERFLSSSRQAFIERDILIEHTVDDACMNADHCGASIDTPSLNADRVVFCRGWRDSL